MFSVFYVLTAYSLRTTLKNANLKVLILATEKAANSTNNHRITSYNVCYTKLLRKLFKNDFYLASNYFVDMGLVTQKYKVDVSKVDDSERSLYFNQGNDKLHMSYGLGINVITSYSIHYTKLYDGT